MGKKRGFAFIEFDSYKTAKKVLEDYNNKTIMDIHLNLSWPKDNIEDIKKLEELEKEKEIEEEEEEEENYRHKNFYTVSYTYIYLLLNIDLCWKFRWYC